MIDNSSRPVFTASNFHSQDFGPPPRIHDDGQSSTYIGYFVNRYGEQWIVCIDRAAKRGVLRGGDLGWEREVLITDGKIGDVILADEERCWLNACWRAACGGEIE